MSITHCGLTREFELGLMEPRKKNLSFAHYSFVDDRFNVRVQQERIGTTFHLTHTPHSPSSWISLSEVVEICAQTFSSNSTGEAIGVFFVFFYINNRTCNNKKHVKEAGQ